MIANRVVYLIGAGATQAEIDHKGGERVNLLMADHHILGGGLSSRIVSKATKYANLPGVSTTEPDLDVEKLISLLDETGLTSHQEAANQLRKLYFQEIIDILSYKGVLDKPELSLLLLQMHNDKLLKDSVEMLLGIINLNHDPLYQIAFEQVCSGVNLGFEFQSETFTNHRGVPPLLKPHGSFNWKRGLPIRTIRLSPHDTSSEDVLWIPPTILKDSKEYPFNKIAAKTLELLTNCDVLRIVGCRLSQNDWNIISLLFSAQCLQRNESNSCFRIELIMPPDTGRYIRSECSYLQNIVTIDDVTDGDFSPYKEDGWETQTELANPFKHWLKKKINYHSMRNELNLDETLPD